MKYEQIKPPEELRPFVRYFWKMESDLEESEHTFRIIADGVPGIFIHQPEQSAFYQNDRKMPAVCLYGQATKSARLISEGKLESVGVYLHPHALRTIFGLNASELTDTCIDLELFSRSREFFLSEKLFATDGNKTRIEALSEFLKAQIKSKNPDSDDAINFALSEIAETNGNVSLKDLQNDLGLSEKSFQRKFKKFVGMPPKLYSRICRFQASLGQLKAQNFMRLSDIAYDNEYSDQSHFIRNFRQFAGFSPNQFQKQSQEIGESLAQITA